MAGETGKKYLVILASALIVSGGIVAGALIATRRPAARTETVAASEESQEETARRDPCGRERRERRAGRQLYRFGCGGYGESGFRGDGSGGCAHDAGKCGGDRARDNGSPGDDCSCDDRSELFRDYVCLKLCGVNFAP